MRKPNLKTFQYNINGKTFDVEITFKKTLRLSSKLVQNTIKINASVLFNKNQIMDYIKKGEERFYNQSLSIDMEGKFFFLFGEKVCFSYENEFVYIDSLKINNRPSKYPYKIVLKHIKEQFLMYVSKRQDELEKELKLRKHEIKIKNMTARWAHISTREHTITYSLLLSHFSHEIIDSVIYHELIHNFFKNHDVNFYKMMETYVPNLKIIRHHKNNFLFKLN